jgi:hypothetical protein
LHNKESIVAESELDLAFSLRDIGLGAVTSTASSTPVACRPDVLATCAWMLYVSAIGAVGTETYSFTLEVSDLSGGSYLNLATWNWPRAKGVGKALVPIVGDQAAFTNTVTRFLRVTATLGGTTTTITYGSGLVKLPTKMGVAAKPGNIFQVA